MNTILEALTHSLLRLEINEAWSSPALPELASAGYLWSASFDDECATASIVRPTAEEATKREQAEHLAIGGAGLAHITLKAQNKGQGVLRVRYQRPWMLDDESGERYDIPVVVVG